MKSESKSYRDAVLEHLIQDEVGRRGRNDLLQVIGGPEAELRVLRRIAGIFEGDALIFVEKEETGANVSSKDG